MTQDEEKKKTTQDLEQRGAPPKLAGALVELKDELARAAEGRLHSLVLFGSLARGRYRPGVSDVNLLMVLADTSTATLDRLAPPLRRAFRAFRLDPLLLARAEMGPAAEAFPTKLLDIQEHHVLLAGEDPFVGLQVSRERIRIRVETELRNLTLRLRRRFVATSDDAAALFSAIADLAVPLSVELETLLSLTRSAGPADDSVAAVFLAGATAFQLDAVALSQVASLKLGQPVDVEPAALLGKILALLERTAELTRGLEGKV